MAKELNSVELGMIKEGLDLIDKNKKLFEEWAISEFKGKSEGWNVGFFYDIAKQVKAGKFEEAYDEMMRMGIATKPFVSLCVEYLNNGDEFLNYAVNRNAELEASATEEKPLANDLVNVVRILSSHKRHNNNVFITFNGQKLYALTDDEDSCWLKVTGMSKAENQEAVRRELEKYEEEKLQRELEYINKMEERIEQGKKLLPSSRWSAWKKELWNMLDCGHISVEDPTDVMLEFFEAWKNKESDEKLDSILYQLDRPESVFFNLKQVMGDEVSSYIEDFKARNYGIENE